MSEFKPSNWSVMPNDDNTFSVVNGEEIIASGIADEETARTISAAKESQMVVDQLLMLNWYRPQSGTPNEQHQQELKILEMAKLAKNKISG